MFRRLTRGREELHKDLDHRFFENLCRERFAIIRTQHVESSSRWLYLLRETHLTHAATRPFDRSLLANLCYLRVWSELLTYTRADTLLDEIAAATRGVPRRDANVLLAGMVFWIAASVAGRSKPTLLHGRGVALSEVAFLLLLLVPLNALRAFWPTVSISSVRRSSALWRRGSWS